MGGNLNLAKVVDLVNSREFEESVNAYIEELKQKDIEKIEYFNDGSFKKDLEKINQYLEYNNDYFDFEMNSYDGKISFINESHLLSIIQDNVKTNEEDYDDQEYDVIYEGLRFMFKRGLGTYITVAKSWKILNSKIHYLK